MHRLQRGRTPEGGDDFRRISDLRRAPRRTKVRTLNRFHTTLATSGVGELFVDILPASWIPAHPCHCVRWDLGNQRWLSTLLMAATLVSCCSLFTRPRPGLVNGGSRSRGDLLFFHISSQSVGAAKESLVFPATSMIPICEQLC